MAFSPSLAVERAELDGRGTGLCHAGCVIQGEASLMAAAWFSPLQSRIGVLQSYVSTASCSPGTRQGFSDILICVLQVLGWDNLSKKKKKVTVAIVLPTSKPVRKLLFLPYGRNPTARTDHF